MVSFPDISAWKHSDKRRATWAGILAATWVLAFIIAEVIPFFSDLLALMSALFDSFFGWIFWGTAYLRMRRADLGPGFWKKRGIRGYVGAAVNVFIICVGFYFLGPGTYVSGADGPPRMLKDANCGRRCRSNQSSTTTMLGLFPQCSTAVIHQSKLLLMSVTWQAAARRMISRSYQGSDSIGSIGDSQGCKTIAEDASAHTSQQST
jgi:hypothetical protein